ncbi:MAG: indole-3-glycerol-phosphate synthase [Haloquadratum sp.]|jgi:indole-3-glycerol phosphate synthase|nr:indole-3-glycerol-phosphate synthase [Haloferacaceae archaeon]MDR9445329.1 indole-3-glycerol-phosphate synthase [Haloquadratum sp.]
MDISHPPLAPSVQAILEAAHERPGGAEPLRVDARPLTAALSAAAAAGARPVIAEIKPTSPTTSTHRGDDPVELARAMVDAGAAALSVLTEPTHFGGDPEMLRRVRAAVAVPVLRKDFIVREDQLDVVAADAVLLIARFLDGPETPSLEALIAAARQRGMTPLVEVHTAAELASAEAAGAQVIGVNNRDLGQLEVDLGVAEALIPTASAPVVIAESGMATPADADRMLAAGADGLLIGSAIMAGDVHERTRGFTTPATVGSA